MESLITSRTWRQQQKRAEHALNKNIQFYDKASNRSPEATEQRVEQFDVFLVQRGAVQAHRSDDVLVVLLVV